MVELRLTCYTYPERDRGLKIELLVDTVLLGYISVAPIIVEASHALEDAAAEKLPAEACAYVDFIQTYPEVQRAGVGTILARIAAYILKTQFGKTYFLGRQMPTERMFWAKLGADVHSRHFCLPFDTVLANCFKLKYQRPTLFKLSKYLGMGRPVVITPLDCLTAKEIFEHNDEKTLALPLDVLPLAYSRARLSCITKP